LSADAGRQTAVAIVEQFRIDKRVEQIGPVFFDRPRREIFVVAHRVEILDVHAYVIAQFEIAV